MYSDTDVWDSDDEDFEMLTGNALQMFLKVKPKSLTFIRYVHQIASLIRHVYPACRPIYFDRYSTTYKTFLSQLKGFLKDLGCPYTEFTTCCIGIAIENQFCRRRLLTYLNTEFVCSLKYHDFYQKLLNKSESSSCEIPRDTPATSRIGNDRKDKIDDEDTMPNNERNLGPGEEQSTQLLQVVKKEVVKKELVGDEPPQKKLVKDEPTKKEVWLEKKFGELTIDTEQPFLSFIPTLQPNYASQVRRSTGMAQYANIDNNFQQRGIMHGSMIQSDSYRNIRSNQNILPNPKLGYRPPAFNHNFNFAFPRQQNTLSVQAVRPIQTDWINPVNRNSLGIWNRQIQCNEGMLQCAHQNPGLHDNIRYNLNHQRTCNVPSPYSHNQNLNIAQQQQLRYQSEYWNTRGSGNIPITQNNQQGWISQGPRNTGLPLFGYTSGITGVGPLYSGPDNSIQRRDDMPHRENQNPSCNARNINSQGPRF